MNRFFSKFGSCFRPRRSPPPLTDDSSIVPAHTSGDYRPVRRSRVHRYRYPQSHWSPALSVIMEDGVCQDHDNNVNRKSDKKSSGKSKSTADVTSFSRWHDKGNTKPRMFISPFTSTPFMF